MQESQRERGKMLEKICFKSIESRSKGRVQKLKASKKQKTKKKMAECFTNRPIRSRKRTI